MRDYELVFIVKPDLTDQVIGTVTAEIKQLAENFGGTVAKEELWGRKQLSFEIKDYTEGVYTFLKLQLPNEAPIKLRDQLKLDERIIRFMITVKEPRKIPKEAAKQNS